MTPTYKTVELSPLTGLLDLRSLPHEVSAGSFRWIENMGVTAKGKRCRRPGFEKLFSEESPYNNQDLHDQLAGDRQPITLLFESRSTTGVSRLVAATQNRIYAINNGTGNWRILSDELGGQSEVTCTGRRWHVAQVEDVLVFTNGSDEPVYWVFDGPPTYANDQSVTTIDDLQELNVTSAQVVISWKGLMMLANVVADGVKVPHRIMWSDFRKPLSFLPDANSSLAGYHDLGYGEDILAAVPLANSLLLYTTHGIWEANVVGGDEVISFTQRYAEPLTGSGCLAFRNTIVSDGEHHYYLGRDGVYVYDFYSPKPQRLDWIHKASSVIFDNIANDTCANHTAGYNSNAKEVWFSWAKQGEGCPSRTLIINTEYQSCDMLERGFTAFTNYSPSGAVSLREWLLEQCICTFEELAANGEGESDKEGGYCVQPDDPVCDGQPQSIYTQELTNVDGVEVEDYTQEVADNDSLCARLGDLTLEDLCAAEQTAVECSANQRFIMASSDDFCIKQYGGIYAHEMCTDFSGCAVYELVGYDSILRSGPIDFKTPRGLKYVKQFTIDCEAVFQTIPTDLIARLGYSRVPTDPNQVECPIMWNNLPAKPIACASSKTEAQHEAVMTRPYKALQWPVFIGGHYIYWELKVSGIGGASCYSSINMDVSVKPATL